MDTVPTTISDWYTRAIHFKTQWDRADAIASRKPYNPYPVQRSHANHQSPKVDPYAMDVNSIRIEKLTKEERENASRKDDAFDAESPDITQETAPLSKATTVTLTPTPKPQENPKNPGR